MCVLYVHNVLCVMFMHMYGCLFLLQDSELHVDCTILSMVVV